MAKVEPGMESMLEMYIFETNTLLEQRDIQNNAHYQRLVCDDGI